MDPSLPRDYALTRVGGVFGPMMAEYVVGWIIAVERGLVSMDRAQARRAWDRAPYAHYRTMDKLTVGILGALGDIGTVVSERLAAMGSSVLGLVRAGRALPDPRASAFAGYEEELPSLLRRCDVVVNLLPSTPATRGLLDGGVLAACAARRPLVINVGRGDVISEESVLQAVREGWVSRFVLDVFPQEPLRPESPLWDHPAVSITPHVAAVSAAEDVAGLFVDNLRRYLAGQEVPHRVDFSQGY